MQVIAARTFLIAAVVLAIASAAFAQSADLKVYADGKVPNDVRLKAPKDLNGYFPFIVPKDKAAWDERASDLRQRILVSTGLWPIPEKTPLKPVIHGKVQRDGFTVEKVYFQSLPGHYVTGLLFRPDDGKRDVKRPAVLCPHGHGGRLQDYGAKNMAKLIASGAEKFEKSGRFPKIARCAQLARMGCVVFVYDMLGYADSQQISYALAHRFAKQRPKFEGKESWGLFSTQAELRLQSVMGIQTWNSIRSLDFLEQLPDVDPKRMAVTGGSGGGTQTILLCAIDSRPIAAFPNGMVSTAMQGGCTCENCSLLRIGTGNVELAALFAPKPQAMTAANDWTRDMMTKGYPELQQLYAMLGVKDHVYCRPMLNFPHNYNYVSRKTMYAWFNKHMKLGLTEPIDEKDFEPLTIEDHAVWNKEHPKPAGGEKYERELTKYLAAESDKQLAAITPKDKESLARFREVVGGALSTIIGRGLPKPGEIERTKVDKVKKPTYLYFEDILRLKSRGEELPVISLFPTKAKWNGDVVIWVHGEGKQSLFDTTGEPRAEIKRLLAAGLSVVSVDLFQQGEFLAGKKPPTQQRTVKNKREFAGYTFAYNDTLFARRVHDIFTLISFVRNDEHAAKRVHLIGVGGAGPHAAVARAIASNSIDKAAINAEGFRFADLTSYRDPNFLPGAVKFGDLPSILALSAPHATWVGGESGKVPEIVEAAYLAAGRPKAIESSEAANETAAVDWLLEQR